MQKRRKIGQLTNYNIHKMCLLKHHSCSWWLYFQKELLSKVIANPFNCKWLSTQYCHFRKELNTITFKSELASEILKSFYTIVFFIVLLSISCLIFWTYGQKCYHLNPIPDPTPGFSLKLLFCHFSSLHLFPSWN